MGNQACFLKWDCVLAGGIGTFILKMIFVYLEAECNSELYCSGNSEPSLRSTVTPSMRQLKNSELISSWFVSGATCWEHNYKVAAPEFKPRPCECRTQALDSQAVQIPASAPTRTGKACKQQHDWLICARTQVYLQKDVHVHIHSHTATFSKNIFLVKDWS